MKLFLERLPKENDVHFPRAWDLLIVDEAHNVAPAGRTRYIADSDRTKCIRSIARHFEHRLFLSATPHNGYLESFQALLELLDEQRFNRAYPPDPAQKQAVMVRRLKSDLPRKADGSLRFPERVIQPLVVPFDQNEMDLHAMLDRYTSLRMGELDDSGSRTESFATRFVLTLLKKRLLSSPAAFHLSLEQHVKTLRTARRRGAKPAEPTEQPSFSLLRKQVDEAEEEYDNDDRRDLSAEAALDSASLLFRPLNNEESQLLEKMRDIASAKESRADSKAKALLKWIETTMRTRGKWNDERVIVFTEYRATQNYLIELLAAEDRVLTLYGGLDKDDRERVKAAFQAPPSDSPVRILVATDAASEGLDFQNYCSRLIHYEIPWNPNRLEQRNGRVDRHGQKADKVEIFHFVSDGFDDPTRTDRLTADFRFLKTVVEKVQQIRVDLGTVGPVIASQVEQAMLGKRKELDTQPTEARAARSRAELKLELDWKKRLARLSDQLNETQHELQITPDNLRRVMAEGLRLAGQPAFEPVTMPNRPSGAWRAPQLRGSWAHCLQGLEHPYTKKPRPVVFDHDLAKNRDDVVLIHLEHPLARRALGLLRAEVWSASKDAQSSLARVTARVIPDRELKTPALIAHARLVLIGQQAQRLHEETVVVGGSYRDDLLTAVPAKTVDRLLSVATNEQPSAAVLAHLGLHFDAHAQQLGELLQGRADELAATLRKSLNERGEKEASAMQKILTDQRAAIQNKLKEWQTPQQQLRFKDFDELERDQIERDTENLRERLRRVESELKTEPASLRDRYRVATPRLFPVALTYLIPASQSGAQR